MWKHLIIVLGLGLLCGGWVLLQRWIARRDPEAKGPEGGGGCSSCSCGQGECKNEKQKN
jgi:hypothetical protein